MRWKDKSNSVVTHFSILPSTLLQFVANSKEHLVSYVLKVCPCGHYLNQWLGR